MRGMSLVPLAAGRLALVACGESESARCSR
jgi:hypothetical protein